MTGGWMEIAGCPTPEKPEDDRRVLIWHAYQMCMVYRLSKVHDNRFITYWQEIPDGWISTADRLPTIRDANALGVVIVNDAYGDIRLRGWRMIGHESDITQWMPTPEAPENARMLKDTIG